MKRTSILLSALGLVTVNVFAADVLFENSTEDRTDGWRHVSRSLARVLMSHEKTRQDIAELAIEGKIPRNASTRLVQRKVPVSFDGNKVWFVRPTLNPYFAPFYGAHTFHHWLISNDRVLHEGSSDAFRIINSGHDGMRDIQEVSCTATNCYITEFGFDGKSNSYKEKSCRVEAVSGSKDTVPCS